MAWHALTLFTALLVVVTAVLAACTWRLVVATYALKDVQEAEFQRLRPKIRIHAPKTSFNGNFLPTGRIELHFINEGQQETTLSSLKISVRDSPHGSRGFPVMNSITLAADLAADKLFFPLHIPGAAHLIFHGRLAGGDQEIIKARIWSGRLS